MFGSSTIDIAIGLAFLYLLLSLLCTAGNEFIEALLGVTQSAVVGSRFVVWRGRLGRRPE